MNLSWSYSSAFTSSAVEQNAPTAPVVAGRDEPLGLGEEGSGDTGAAVRSDVHLLDLVVEDHHEPGDRGVVQTSRGEASHPKIVGEATPHSRRNASIASAVASAGMPCSAPPGTST